MMSAEGRGVKWTQDTGWDAFNAYLTSKGTYATTTYATGDGKQEQASRSYFCDFWKEDGFFKEERLFEEAL